MVQSEGVWWSVCMSVYDHKIPTDETAFRIIVGSIIFQSVVHCFSVLSYVCNCSVIKMVPIS